MTGSTVAPSFCPTNLATGSATPPSTVIAIMPTRSFPSGAISEAGDVCPNATPEKLPSNAIDRRSRLMCASPPKGTCMPTTPARSRLDLKRQARVIDKPLDQFVLHRCARRPDPRWHVGRIAQQADRAFRHHLRGRAVTGIAVALHRDTRLTAVGRDRDIEQVIHSVVAFFLGWPLAWLGLRRRCHLVVCRDDALGLGLTLLARARHLHLVVDKILTVRKTQQHVGAMHVARVDVGHEERRQPCLQVLVVNRLVAG